MKEPIPSAKFLASISYDPVTGLFTRVRSRNPKAVGTTIRRTHGARSGYILVSVGKEKYYGHRLAWFLVHGRWPEPTVDHKNSDRSDNRIENLREATWSLNGANRQASGPFMKGVTFSKGKYVAQIKVHGRVRVLGRHRTEEEAHAAYCAAASEAFGDFARFA